MLGGALGAAKAGLICAAVLLAVVYFAPDGGDVERSIGTSRAAPILWTGMDRLAGVLPAQYRQDARGFLNSYRPAPGAPGADTQTQARGE
jgi:hypothetical protein